MKGAATEHADLAARGGSASGYRCAPSFRVVLYELLSGTNDYGVELVRSLSKVVPLTVITVDNTKLSPGLNCKVLPVVPAFAKPVSRVRKLTAMACAYGCLIRECLRDPRRTVLHIEFLRFERFEAVLFRLLQGLGVKLVYSAHNALPHDQLPWHQAFYRKWYERVDTVHVLSPSVQRSIEQKVGARPKKFSLVGHGPYDGLKKTYRNLSRVQERAKRGIPAEAFVVLQYGLFKAYKGLDTLIDAACQLRGHSGFFLVMAGAGPVEYLNDLQQRLDTAQMDGHYLWYREFVLDKDLCELIALADVIIFPYRKVSQSGALYLALTFDKPVLCSDLPGFRETLPNNDCFFFGVGSAPELVNRLQELMSDVQALNINQDLVHEMRKGGFDWDSIAADTQSMYADLFNG